MFKSRAEKHFSCFLFATELLSPRVCRQLLYFLTADFFILMQTHIFTYSALNLLTQRYDTYSTYKYKIIQTYVTRIRLRLRNK